MENLEIQLVNVGKATKILSLSRSKIYEMVARQEIPYVRFNRHIKFDVNDLRKFINSKKKENFVFDFNVCNLKGKNYMKK